MIAAIIARLEAEVVALKSVQGAGVLAATNAQPKRMPGAFVYLLSEGGGANRLANGIDQRIAAEFAVLMAVQNLRDGRGEAAIADLEPIRDAVRAALLNWAPIDGHEATIYRSGRVMAMNNQVVWWQDVYATAYHIRQL